LREAARISVWIGRTVELSRSKKKHGRGEEGEHFSYKDVGARLK